MDERLESEGRVKQAVKEALTEKQVSDLIIAISKLDSKMEKGFDGIHQRQDTTNGKVLKSREDILLLQGDQKDTAEKVALITKVMYGIAATVGLTVLGAILAQVIPRINQ